MSLNTKRHRGQNVLEEKMSWRTKHRRNKNVLEQKTSKGDQLMYTFIYFICILKNCINYFLRHKLYTSFLSLYY